MIMSRTGARKRPSRRRTRPIAGLTAEEQQKAAEADLAREPAVAAMPARHRETDRKSGAILQASGLTKRYGGLVANSDIDFTVNHGEAARHHRPERRRQDHVLQDADLRGAADLRARLCSRAATSPA